MRIVIKIIKEGVHYWQDCNIDEVSYLKNLHRHLFYIRLEKEVNHNDRDIEIIQYKHLIEKYLNDKYYDVNLNLLNFQGMSCESIATELQNNFDLNLVEVLEDNENGAIIC